MPKESDNRLPSPLRRVPSVAIFTLAALGAQDLSHQALAITNGDVTDEARTKEAGDLVTPAAKEEKETKEATLERSRLAIASPEVVVVQEFTPESSRTSELPTAQAEDRDTAKVVEPSVGSQTSIARNTGIAAPETEVMLARNATPEERSLPALPPSASQVDSATLGEIQSYSARDLLEVPSPEPNAVRIQNSYASASQETANPQATEKLVAQGTSTTAKPCVKNGTLLAQATPRDREPCVEVDDLQNQLRDLENLELEGDFRASPALSIVIPTAFGADNNTGFISATYQNRTRYSDVDDGALGVGIGLGDAREAVGVELSYAVASFGSNRDFGSGGFNVKVHRQLPNDFAVAAGWNGFLNIGDDNDFEDSIYGVVSKVIRTRDNINLPFSRVAITAGVGTGQFQPEEDVADGDGINVFGNIAVRVAEPVSVIAEWSGQDLGVGVSIAPFKNIPLVITPAVRDITGAGDGARFVLGTGFAFKF
ncbi:MAG: hypothetical protein F6K28_33515 [Microcoleus sp. SIO2G3]|nr:hypothetical protein [Microcoleus sp. SIO2G3]